MVSIPLLFPPGFATKFGNKNLYVLASGVARKLSEVGGCVNSGSVVRAAFMSLQRIAEVVGAKQFSG